MEDYLDQRFLKDFGDLLGRALLMKFPKRPKCGHEASSVCVITRINVVMGTRLPFPWRWRPLICCSFCYGT